MRESQITFRSSKGMKVNRGGVAVVNDGNLKDVDSDVEGEDAI